MTDAEKYAKLRDRVLAMDGRFWHMAALHNPDADASPSMLLGDLAHLVHQAADWCREHPPTPTFQEGDRVRILLDKEHSFPEVDLHGYTAVVTDPLDEHGTVEVHYDPPLPSHLAEVFEKRRYSPELCYYAPEELELVERKEHTQ